MNHISLDKYISLLYIKEAFSTWSSPTRDLSDVPVSRNWYKTGSNLYESFNINNILYKNRRFIQIIFSHTQQRKRRYPRETSTT